MDYKANLSTTTDVDEDEDVQSVTLALPAGIALLEKIQMFVMLDMFSVYNEAIQ